MGGLRRTTAAIALVAGPATMTLITEATAPAGAAPGVTRFKNCKALNAVYRHGVGLPGARDKTTGRPVTNFTRNAAVYKANTARDGDKDGIACEKR